MKKIVGVLAGVMFVTGAMAQEPGDILRKDVEDRVEAKWVLTCSGAMEGAQPGSDWVLKKGDMTYVAYGVLSHSVVNFLNTSIVEGGNMTFEAMGIDTRLKIVE